MGGWHPPIGVWGRWNPPVRGVPGVVPPGQHCRVRKRCSKPTSEVGRDRAHQDHPRRVARSPAQWYNVIPDLPAPPPPPLHPGTRPAGRPGRPRAALPDGAHRARRSPPTRYVDIPGEVLDVYRLWRPTPLFRARRLEKALGHAGADLLQVRGRLARPGRTSRTPRSRRRTTTPAEGIKRLTTETGAGQWGTALAFACAQFGLECEVWKVARVLRPEAVPPHDDGDLGRHRAPEPVASSPRRAGRCSPTTPTRPARSGIAISEAVEAAGGTPTTSYALGSVLNHVLLHQTVIGAGGAAAARDGRRDRRT